MFRSLNQKDAVLSCAEEVVVWDSFDGSLLFFFLVTVFFLANSRCSWTLFTYLWFYSRNNELNLVIVLLVCISLVDVEYPIPLGFPLGGLRYKPS